MKTGRPTKISIAERHKRIRLSLYVSALVSEEVTTRIAGKIGVSDKVVRGDLESMRDAIEGGPSAELTEDLTDAIEAADSFRDLKTLGKRVMRGMVKGSIDRALGSALVEALREQRQILVKARDEDGETALAALEILLPQEQEVLRKYRESLTPPALKPGEFPAPPEGVTLPSSATPTPGEASGSLSTNDDRPTIQGAPAPEESIRHPDPPANREPESDDEDYDDSPPLFPRWGPTWGGGVRPW